MEAATDHARASDADPVSCLGCEARRRGICRAATSDELVQFARISRRRVFASGDRIHSPGQGDMPLGNVLSGVVGVAKTLSDGRQQIVGLKFAADFFGRPFAPDDGCEMHAMGPVRVCVFQRSAFEPLVTASGRIEHELLARVLDDLDTSREWMLMLGRKTSLERVASCLELIGTRCRRSAPDGEADIIPLPLTRGEMASFLGMTIETVSRKMTELRRLGVIEFSDASSVRIVSQSRLHAMAGS